DGALQGLVAMAQAHPHSTVAHRSGPAQPAHGEAAAREVRSAADANLAARGVDRRHVARRRSTAAEAAALADGGAVAAVRLADPGTVPVGDPPRAAALRADLALDELVVRRSGDEADVLALGLVRYGKLERRGDRTHRGLVQIADREERPLELALPE